MGLFDKKIFTLMNKNTEVLDFSYSNGRSIAQKVVKVKNIDFAPVSMLGFYKQHNKINANIINQWWDGRSIPASRQHFANLSRVLQMTPKDLQVKNYGLSLSDQYWINNKSEPRQWSEINFFDNDFSDDVGRALFGNVTEIGAKAKNFSLITPDGSLNGNLQKKWKIINGERYLIKGSALGTIRQEVVNEVIATKLYERLLNKNEFVAYSLFEEYGQNFSLCKNMVTVNTEYVPAAQILELKDTNNITDLYKYTKECYQEFGISEIDTVLSKLTVCDYLLANYDRHYNNFGAIRDVNTLEVLGAAPIFDSGSCLFTNIGRLPDIDTINYKLLPFDYDYKEALCFVTKTDWFEPDKLNGFTDEIRDILVPENFEISAERVNVLCDYFDSALEDIKKRSLEIAPIHSYVPEIELEKPIDQFTKSVSNVKAAPKHSQSTYKITRFKSSLASYFSNNS